MATTLISSKKSSYGSPYAYYTITAEETSRTSSAVTIKFTAKGKLASSSSWLGTGLVLKAGVYIGGAWKTWTLKSSSSTWSGTSWHSASASFTISTSITTTSLTGIKVRVLRTDSNGNGAELKAMTATTSTISILNSAKFTISFNANGGTGAPSAITKNYSSAVTLPSTYPTKASEVTEETTVTYTCQGWSKSKTATAASYTKSTSFSEKITSNLTLYAVWKSSLTENQWGITFDYGDDYWPTVEYVNKGSSIILPTPTKAYYAFDKWYTGQNKTGSSYAGGATFTPTADTVLYAGWNAHSHTVTFNVNGGTGSVPASFTKTIETTNIIPEDTYPSKANANFSHWNTQPDGSGKKYEPGEEYTHIQNGGSVVLYAIYWENAIIFYNGASVCQAMDFIEDSSATGITLSNTGDVYAKEFIENTNSLYITKTGQIKALLKEGGV